MYTTFINSLGKILHQTGHGHSHNQSNGHSQDHSNNDNNDRNINIRAAFIHVIGDFIQSIGVLIAAYVIKYVVSKFYNYFSSINNF